MSMWQKLASMLGVRGDQVEDALKNERGARRNLSRRGFLLGAVALATDEILPGPKLYSFPLPAPAGTKLPAYWATAVAVGPIGPIWAYAVGLHKGT